MHSQKRKHHYFLYGFYLFGFIGFGNSMLLHSVKLQFFMYCFYPSSMFSFDEFHRRKRIRQLYRRKRLDYEDGINNLEDLRRVVYNLIYAPERKEEEERELIQQTKEKLKELKGTVRSRRARPQVPADVRRD